MTFEQMIGANAFSILGTMKGLLGQIDKAIDGDSTLADDYMAEAQSGGYGNLLKTTLKYGLAYTATTLEIDNMDLDYYEAKIEQAS